MADWTLTPVVLLLSFSLAVTYLVYYLGLHIIYPILGYIIILKYFVRHPDIFKWMIAVKFLVPLFFDSIYIFDLSSPHTEFQHWNELYSTGNLQIGDLIEFNRSSYDISYASYFSNFFQTYRHWGVYVEDDTVMHLTMNHPSGEVIIHHHSSLKEASLDGSCRVNNLERAAEKYGWRRGTKQELMLRARLVLEEMDKRFIPGKKYDGAYTNCEHFATYLVFGEPISLQADHVVHFYAKKLGKDLIIVLALHWTFYCLFNSQIFQDFWHRTISHFLKLNSSTLSQLENLARWPDQNPVLFYSGVVLFAVLFSTIFFSLF